MEALNFTPDLSNSDGRLHHWPTNPCPSIDRPRHLSRWVFGSYLQASEVSIDNLGLLRGHYAYYGIPGNIRALQKVYRAVEHYWRKMLNSRSWKADIWWEKFQQIKARFPLLRPKLYLPYAELQAIAKL